jgi:hypothetical protein
MPETELLKKKSSLDSLKMGLSRLLLFTLIVPALAGVCYVIGRALWNLTANYEQGRAVWNRTVDNEIVSAWTCAKIDFLAPFRYFIRASWPKTVNLASSNDVPPSTSSLPDHTEEPDTDLQAGRTLQFSRRPASPDDDPIFEENGMVCIPFSKFAPLLDFQAPQCSQEMVNNGFQYGNVKFEPGELNENRDLKLGDETIPSCRFTREGLWLTEDHYASLNQACGLPLAKPGPRS